MREKIRTTIFSVFLISLLFLWRNGEVLAQSGFWQSIKRPFGGSVGTLVFDATSDLLYAVGEGGLYGSADGEIWQKLGLSNRYIGALAVNSRGDLFAGVWNSGIFVSRDNGIVWEQKPLDEGVITAIAVSASDDIFAGSSDGTVYRSRDDGQSWQQVTRCGQFCSIRDIVINDSGYIFAATDGNYILRSPDGGDTWSVSSNGLSSGSFTSLAAHPDGEVFAAASTVGGGLIFRTENDGESWSGPLTVPDPVLCLTFTASGELLAGTEAGGIYSSADRGDSWTALGLANITVPSLLSDPAGVLYAGTNGGGIFRSVDRNTWKQVGLGSLDVGEVFAGLQDTLVVTYRESSQIPMYFSADLGETWVPAAFGDGRNTRLSDLTTDANNRLFGLAGGILMQFNRNELIWETLTAAQGFTALYIMPDETVFLGTRDGEIYRTVLPATSLARVFVEAQGADITTFSSMSVDHVFAGTSVRGIYRSTDGGFSWSRSGLPSVGIDMLATDARGNVVAATGTFGYGVFVSKDGGETWRPHGLSETSTPYLEVTDGGVIFIGTCGNGIHRSHVDTPKMWQQFTDGLPGPHISSLDIGADHHLYVATEEGLVRSTDIVTSVSSKLTMPDDFGLQNYPNPFNPSTTIRYTLQHQADVTIKVYNLRGREVATLVDEKRAAGEHAFEWHPGELGSGVYVITLTAGRFRQSQKVVLLK